MKEINIAKLQQLLTKRGGKTICPNQLGALIEKAYYEEQTTLDVARNILRPQSTDILEPEAVMAVLSAKGKKLGMTYNQWSEAKNIPFSRETLEMVARREWRGKRAILWWAPPKSCGINMLRLRRAFGTNPAIQPCVYDNDWWLKERFAKEIMPQGWHLTLVEIPDETRDKTYEQQKELITGKETLVKLVELMFLSLLNYEINKGERLFENDYSRTGTLASVGRVVDLGLFGSDGLVVGGWHPSHCYSDVGLVFSRKFD